MSTANTVGTGYVNRTMHGVVVDRIGIWIVAGDYPEGSVLPPEPALATVLGVSRTATREAVKALAAKGFLEVRPKLGTVVRPKREWNMLDAKAIAWQLQVDPAELLKNLTQVRYLLEPQIAAMAARLASSADVAALRHCLDDMGRAHERDDFETLIAADLNFHRLLFDIPGNPLLTAISRALDVAISASFDRTSRIGGSMSSGLVQHQSLLAAIEAHDEMKAAELGSAVIHTAESGLVQSLNQSNSG